MSTQQTIDLFFGGRSGEHAVSILSARTIYKGLLDAGYTVRPVGIGLEGRWHIDGIARDVLEGRAQMLPAAAATDMREQIWQNKSVASFLITHGQHGEDGRLTGCLETMGCTPVGTDTIGAAAAFDKFLAKSVLWSAGVPVVPSKVIDRHEWLGMTDVEVAYTQAPAFFDADGVLDQADPFPLFVKPAQCGSSVGCHKVQTWDTLSSAIDDAFEHGDRVLIEQALDAREVECAVRFDKDGEIVLSGFGEIRPAADFYDFDDKYIDGDAGLIIPAEIDEAVKREMKKYAEICAQRLLGNGFARIDFFLTKEGIYLNEANVLPGFTAISMYPKLFAEAGVPLPTLLKHLIDEAIERKNRQEAQLRKALATVKPLK